MVDIERENDVQSLNRTNLPLYLQAYLADVESKKLFPHINKDYAYSNLNEGQIAMMENRNGVFGMVLHNLIKLYKNDHPKSKNTKLPDMIPKFSSLQALLSMNASTAILNMSREGWARELAVTQKFQTKIGTAKRKLFGFGKKEEDSNGSY